MMVWLMDNVQQWENYSLYQLVQGFFHEPLNLCVWLNQMERNPIKWVGPLRLGSSIHWIWLYTYYNVYIYTYFYIYIYIHVYIYTYHEKAFDFGTLTLQNRMLHWNQKNSHSKKTHGKPQQLSRNITQYCPIQPLCNPYIGRICWYVFRVHGCPKKVSSERLVSRL